MINKPPCSVPPMKPVIVDGRGNEVHSTIGPFSEGELVLVSCEVSGGNTAFLNLCGIPQTVPRIVTLLVSPWIQQTPESGQFSLVGANIELLSPG